MCYKPDILYYIYSTFYIKWQATHLSLLLRLLGGGELGGLVQGVAGDGEEDVEEGPVPAQQQDHEVDRVDGAPALPTPLRSDGSVHHIVPVLPR